MANNSFIILLIIVLFLFGIFYLKGNEIKVLPDKGSAITDQIMAIQDYCISKGFKYSNGISNSSKSVGECIGSETTCPAFDYFEGYCQVK